MGKSPQVIAVVGGQWGDEGKGKIVDYLASDCQVVVRAQGGDNAGHTVINSQGTFKLHLIPSGIFNSKTTNIIGPGTVVNPNSLISEIDSLNQSKISTKKLILSEKSHLILDFHIYLDSMQERLRGQNKIGTTQKGIGPAYTSKVKRMGLRAYLLKNPDRFLTLLKQILAQEALYFSKNNIPNEFKVEYYEEKIKNWSKILSNFIGDSDLEIGDHLDKGSKILIEGAQGALLDLDHGTYPYATSSNTSVNGLLNGSGIPAGYLTKVVGVFKAYQTRVGEGGMPTELKNKLGEQIRVKGQEFGTTTGRPRRVGYFDSLAASYSHLINKYTDIALTRLDILSGIKELNICSKYSVSGKDRIHFPIDDQILSQAEPFYIQKDTFSGWEEDLSMVRSFKDLPKQAQDYCQAISKIFKGAKLSLIGVGPQRDSLIVV
ncbi:adenylosuccinate synthase [Candidatus Daviesbacteria bacterium]|nr:adenylosuccinate synthase [Candidatus Daviesbacteria bacterium]